MRMLFLILGGVIVLGGGAAGAYFYFQQPAEASAGDAAKSKHAEDSHGDDGDGHGLSSPEYVELDPLILPIVDETGVTQTVSLVVALEVQGASARSKVEAMKPKLKDAYIQDMYGVLNKHAALKGGVIQVDILKKRLKKVSKEIMGDKIDDVLLQVVQQRRI